MEEIICGWRFTVTGKQQSNKKYETNNFRVGFELGTHRHDA
jgi:hypothetical protein